MGNGVDGNNRTIVVSVKGTFRYTVEDKLVHTESADRGEGGRVRRVL